MKITKLLIAVLFPLIMSCEKLELDGKWDPIKVDKQHLNFTSEGGEQKVTMQNYSRWRISGAYENATQVNGSIEYTNYIHPTSTDGEEAYTYDQLDGGWYRVSVPDKGKSNTAVIAVDKNQAVEARKATIIMTVGDAFTNIQINQR